MRMRTWTYFPIIFAFPVRAGISRTGGGLREALRVQALYASA